MLFWPPSSLLMAGEQFISAERAVDFIFFSGISSIKIKLSNSSLDPSEDRTCL